MVWMVMENLMNIRMLKIYALMKSNNIQIIPFSVHTRKHRYEENLSGT